MFKQTQLSITLSAETTAVVKKVTSAADFTIVDFTITTSAGSIGSSFTVPTGDLTTELKEGMKILISPNGDVQQHTEPSKPSNARTPTQKSVNLD